MRVSLEAGMSASVAAGRAISPHQRVPEKERRMSTPPVTPEPIMNVCTGLWAAGVLKGAIELQL